MNQLEAIQFLVANHNEGSHEADSKLLDLVAEIVASKNTNTRYDADELQAKIDEIAND